MRNPWGEGREWKGRFSDGDAAWAEARSRVPGLRAGAIKIW